MGVTSFGDTNLDAIAGRVKIVAALPTAPSSYYDPGASGFDEWRGGEVVYLSTTDKLHVQTATSGKTATWVILDVAFSTSTTSSTSSSTSSSSSTTTSSSSSSSSSSTSTSTSTSSSSSSSSTSSSSTTTMA